jgi:hypothetical protein
MYENLYHIVYLWEGQGTSHQFVFLQIVCQSIAVVLHYSFLVTFMWMLMEGVVLYVALVKVFVTKPRRYIISFTVISYGQSSNLIYMLYSVNCTSTTNSVTYM